MPAAIPYIIMSAAQIGSSVIQSHGNTSSAKTAADASDKAAQIQAESADKALAQAKEIYQQQRADEGPYRQSGYGAVNALNFGLGLPPVSYQAPAAAAPTSTNGTNPAPTHTTLGGVVMPERTRPPGTPSQGTAVPRGSLASLGRTAGGTTRSVRAPNGLVYLVPSEQLAAAQANGGQVVG